MPRGGRRQGAGRPPTSQTIRKTVSWRLPIHVLTRVYKNAALEGITVTAWVEHALLDALKRKPRKDRQAA
ncbi:MAG TPA: hypothetical protein VI837_04410 [Blastocatellia bacterium]|nr:hypothetical protein [Blastocatellia bacterium]